MSLFSRRLASERYAIRICGLIAIALGALAVWEFRDEPLRNFSHKGRGWGPLRELLFTHFGPAGLAALWLALALLVLMIACWIWRHADRVPSDRWYGS